MELQAEGAHRALTDLGLRRDVIYEMMDEHRSYREATTAQLWDLVRQSRDGKFKAWQELKEHEHLLVWLYTLQAKAGVVPYEAVAGLLQSDLYGYEQRYREAVSNLVVARAQFESFDAQAEEAFLELQSKNTDLRREQEAVVSAARESSRELRRQLLELRAQMASLRSESDLLYKQEDERIDALKRKIRSKRAYREILRESLRRLRKGPTRGYALKSLFVSSRRRLSGRERGDALSPLAVQIPSSVAYEATVNSGQGECLGACIERTFQEHLGKLVRRDVRTLHSHLVYRQWAVADALTACLDSVGRVVDYLYTFVQPITTAWNLVPFSFVVDWGADFSTVTKNLESIVMGAVSTAQPSEAWDVHKLTPVYGDNWSRWVEPLSVEAEWIDPPGSFRRTHRVRITLSGVETYIDYRASEDECVLRYPFSLNGLGAIIPPTSLEKFFDHALEIGALVATITK
jgi:ketosteroid isomerase-like protein